MPKRTGKCLNKTHVTMTNKRLLTLLNIPIQIGSISRDLGEDHFFITENKKEINRVNAGDTDEKIKKRIKKRMLTPLC